MVKKIGISIMVFFFLIVFISGCFDSKAPAIHFDGQSYKFGEAVEGENIVFTFFFTNPGSKDLIIKELFVSCFCVNVKEYDKLVKPGSKGKIYGVINTTGFLGEISKAIRVATNVPGIEDPVLVMEGKILARATE